MITSSALRSAANAAGYRAEPVPPSDPNHPEMVSIWLSAADRFPAATVVITPGGLSWGRHYTSEDRVFATAEQAVDAIVTAARAGGAR